MTKEIQEKAILSTQYKIDKLKRETGIFSRNKLKTIGFGALLSIFGPFYASDSDIRGNSRSALEVSETSHLNLTIAIIIFYTVAVVIAHFVWDNYDQRKLKRLQEKKKQLELELELFHTDKHYK